MRGHDIHIAIYTSRAMDHSRIVECVLVVDVTIEQLHRGHIPFRIRVGVRFRVRVRIRIRARIRAMASIRVSISVRLKLGVRARVSVGMLLGTERKSLPHGALLRASRCVP